MAITGKFQADFESFYSAVQKAEISLRSFESGAGKVETSLNRMVDSFSGRKVITDAQLMAEAIDRIGGVTRLTETEFARVSKTAGEAVAKMRAMGIDVPPGLQKIAEATGAIETPTQQVTARMIALGSAIGSFVGNFAVNLIQQGVSALIHMGKEAFTSAGEIVDLSAKTGLSTTAIQQMQFVAEQTGGTLEGFTKAAFQLGVRLSGGGGSVAAGVRDLHLSLDALQAMRPEEQFNTIIAALEKMENPQERNRIALALFGKTVQEVIPAIAEGYTTLANEAPISSEAQVRALERAGDAWDAFVARVKTNIRSWLGDMVVANDNWSKFTNDQKDFYIDLQAGADKTAASQYILNQRFGDIALPAEKATAALIPYVEQLVTARAELASLTAADYAEIEAAKALGISNTDLADALGLSTTALAVANDELKKRKTELAETEKAEKSYRDFLNFVGEREIEDHKRIIAEKEKADAEYRKFQNEIGTRQMEEEAARMKQAEADAAARLKAEQEWWKSMGDGLVIIGQTTAAHAEAGNTAVDAATRGRTAYEGLNLAVKQVTESTISWADAMAAVQAGLGSMGGTLQTGGPWQGTRAQVEAAWAAGRYWGPVTPDGKPDWKRIGLASGGPAMAGRPYLVGERGPELFVPGTSGTVVPNGVGGNVTVNFYDAFLDTPAGAQRTASRLGSAVLSTISGQGRPIG